MATDDAAAQAALMLVQSTLLALLEKGVLTGEDVLAAVQDVITTLDDMDVPGSPCGDLEQARAVVRCFADQVLTATDMVGSARRAADTRLDVAGHGSIPTRSGPRHGSRKQGRGKQA